MSVAFTGGSEENLHKGVLSLYSVFWRSNSDGQVHCNECFNLLGYLTSLLLVNKYANVEVEL